MTFFGFPKVKWLQYTGKVGKCRSYQCNIFSGYNIPKLIKVLTELLAKIKRGGRFFVDTMQFQFLEQKLFTLSISTLQRVTFKVKRISKFDLYLTLSIKLARIRMNDGNFSLQVSVVQPLITKRQSRTRSRPQSNSLSIKKYNISKTKPCVVFEL